MHKQKGRTMSPKNKKERVILLIKILLPLLIILLFFPNKTLLSKELAPHKIFGHLILGEETLTNLTEYQITARLTRSDIQYSVATFQHLLDDIHYVLDIPLDDALEEGIPTPDDTIDILVDSFVMLKDIPLEIGQITQQDITLCANTELLIEIQGIEEGADYQEDILPIIRTWGCGVSVTATLNGAPYTPGTLITQPNHYTLTVDAQDASGATQQEEVSFTRSTTFAETLNGDFTSGLSGWSLEGTTTLISLTDISLDPNGSAALIDPPAPGETAEMHSDLIYALSDSIMDLSLYIHGKAGDEMLLSVISYTDDARQNPISLITEEILYPTVDYAWQQMAIQLIIPEGQYFIEVILARDDQIQATEAIAIDSIALTPVSFIASTLYQKNLWVSIEEGARNLLSGTDPDLGIFDDPNLSTVSNIPGTTCGKKTLRLANTQILREVYLTPGTYSLSLDAWSENTQEFILDIGSDTHTLTTGSELTRHALAYTATEEGWCSIGITGQTATPILITQIQLEKGTSATHYTPAGRSPGYLKIEPGNDIDFSQPGLLSFVFSPHYENKDMFLAGTNDWGIAYDANDQTISFAPDTGGDICSVDLSPEGVSATAFYQVLLSWDGIVISLSVNSSPGMEPLGYSESTDYDNEISSGAFFVGSRLIGINQFQPANATFGNIYFKTLALGCVQFPETCVAGSAGTYEITEDTDGDNYTVCQGDCDEDDPNINPNAEEICDGKDNDCDGSLDPDEVDADGDGVMVCEGDCDDADPSVFPGATEICDGKDNDCDGNIGPGEVDIDEDNIMVCEGDCNDSDPNINPDATEICDGKDNDCDGLKDEEDAEGCTIYYKDNDEDGYGVDEDSRCLCSQDPNTKYTATKGGDPDDLNSDIPANYINFHLNLPEGWSMISLPVIPENSKASELFPEAVVMYSYKKEAGYVRVTEEEDLEAGKGYWILLDQDEYYTLTGQPIHSYNLTVYEDRWEMIGGCTTNAQTTEENCNIVVIYSYAQGAGYQRVTGSIQPGKGYWILFNDVIDQAHLNVVGTTK